MVESCVFGGVVGGSKIAHDKSDCLRQYAIHSGMNDTFDSVTSVRHIRALALTSKHLSTLMSHPTPYLPPPICIR